MYVKYPLSLRNVEDLLSERGIDTSYETVRFWWNRFGPIFAAEIRKKRVHHTADVPCCSAVVRSYADDGRIDDVETISL